MTLLIGDTKPEAQALDSMRTSRYNYPDTRWAAYQNHALDSASVGHLIFLAVGPENTYKNAPKTAPDGKHGCGWKFVHVGWVDLETGEIREERS